MEKYDSFYTTRYMGAKYKLLDFLIPPIEKLLIPGGTFIDLTAGTHAVGYALKRRNRIVANDVQYYSKIFGDALIVNQELDKIDDQTIQIFHDYETEQTSGWFTETYGGTYFSAHQCSTIEQIRARIETVDSDSARSILLTVLCNAMSICQSSSGHFAQYMPATNERIKALQKMDLGQIFLTKLKEVEICLSSFCNISTCLEVSDFFANDSIVRDIPSGSLAYLDPPYTSAQYSRYYHILETVILNDEPDVSHKARYRTDRFQSPFCSTRLAPKAFESILEATSSNGWNFVMSYSNRGVMAVEDLTALASKYFRHVTVNAQPYVHSMQGRGMTKDRIELAVVCSHPL